MTVVARPMSAPRSAAKSRDRVAVTEDSAALEFVARFQDALRFDHSRGAWFKFDGATWRRDGTRCALEWAREIGRELARSFNDERTHAITGRAGFAKGVETLARVDQRIAVTSECWDRDPFLLGTPSGTVDLRTGNLREPDPADLISKTTAVGPAASGDCPLWCRFLDDATGGDASLVAFLQRWAGYCLTADVRDHALLFIVGDGGNGKSVFLNTLRGVMGSYAVNAAMDTFVAAYGEKHPADLAALHGARLVTASETERGRAWDEVRLKTLTGGDPISARFMRGNYFNFDPTFKLTFTGNFKPDIRGVNEAMRRRINIVAFDYKPATPDALLEQRLRSEWPGILRWAIDGCREWQVDGLRRPAAVIAASESYFSDQDVIGRWIDDECVFDPGNELMRTPSSDLWKSWCRYASSNAKGPGRMNDLVSALEKRGAKPFRTNTARGLRGIALRTCESA